MSHLESPIASQPSRILRPVLVSRKGSLRKLCQSLDGRVLSAAIQDSEESSFFQAADHGTRHETDKPQDSRDIAVERFLTVEPLKEPYSYLLSDKHRIRRSTEGAVLNRSLVGSPINYVEADLECKRRSQQRAEKSRRRRLRKGFTKPNIAVPDVSPALPRGMMKLASHCTHPLPRATSTPAGKTSLTRAGTMRPGVA